jgi:hypothetical protein
VRILVMVLMALTLVSPDVWAQTVASSFAELQPMLSVGQELKVRDEQGRTRQGKLASISGDELVISRRRFFFRTEERTFSEHSVTSVDLKDSAWNGSLIGAAAGFGFGLALLRSCDDTGTCLSLATVWPFLVAGGGELGTAIDNRYTKRVYEKSPQTGPVTLAPLVGRETIGAVVRLGF